MIRGLEHSVPVLTSGEKREEIEFNHQLAKDVINHVKVMTTPKETPKRMGFGEFLVCRAKNARKVVHPTLQGDRCLCAQTLPDFAVCLSLHIP